MGDASYPMNGTLVEPLTWREQDVLSLLAERQTDREIAQALGLELTTIKWYNKQIYGKLGVGSRYQAVAKAEEYGLLDETLEARPAEGAPSKGNLAVPLTSFVGRERESAEVKRLLRDRPLLTLTGPPGTGKTRLALRVAADLLDDFPDGVFFVDLAPVNRPDLVADTTAEALGVIQSAGPSASDRLATFLRNKKLLLLIDNFEHLLEAAPLVGELLSAAPDVKALLTSREALRLYGEQEYPVPPLGLPDLSDAHSLAALGECEAIALFAQRARAVSPDFTLTDENAPTVAEICVRLDGLPLAIELAAARVKFFSPQALLGQLASGFAALRDGPRGLPERQQTLRGAIDWSYNQLDEAEKTFFARLAVFQGGRTIEAVEAVCCHDQSIDVLDGLESLLNKSLLRQEERSEGEPRFVMLETIHEYARQRLLESGEADDIQRRHAEYFTALAERAYPDTRGGPRQMQWLRRLNADYDNLRTALEWSLGGADVALGLRLTGALAHFWYRWYHLADGQRWTARAIEADSDRVAPPEVRAASLEAASMVGIFQDDHVASLQNQREVVALYRELGDRHSLSWALIELSLQSIGMPDEYDKAVAICEEGVALLREVEDNVGVAVGLNVLGELARVRGDYSLAKDIYEECVSIARETGDTLRELKQYMNLGFVAQHDGEQEAAKANFQTYLTLAMEMKFTPGTAYVLVALAGPAAAMGQPVRAARLLGAGFAQFDQLGIIPQPADLPEFERNKESAREQLGKAAFEAAWAEGQAMSLEQAIAYALEEPAT